MFFLRKSRVKKVYRVKTLTCTVKADPNDFRNSFAFAVLPQHPQKIMISTGYDFDGTEETYSMGVRTYDR